MTDVGRREGNNTEGGLGDGQAAWQAIREKCSGVRNTPRQEHLQGIDHSRGSKRQEILHILETAIYRLHDMGEQISPEWLGHLLPGSLTPT